MAGAFIRIDIDDREWVRARQGIERLLQDPRALLEDIGEHLQLSADERFERKVGPDGKPWAQVSQGYAERKEAGKATARSGAVRDPSQILQLSRDLRRLTRYQIEGHELLQGSDRVYAATHQFGDPRRGIVARPIYGLSSADDEAIEEMCKEHLQVALRGG